MSTLIVSTFTMHGLDLHKKQVISGNKYMQKVVSYILMIQMMETQHYMTLIYMPLKVVTHSLLELVTQWIPICMPPQ